MKFVIMDCKEIPGYPGIRGPILTPTTYNLHLVIRWLWSGLDVREVMEDGSFRKLESNDARINEELNKQLNKKIEVEEVVPKPRETIKVKAKIKSAKRVEEKIVIDPEPEEKKVKKPEFDVDDLEPM